MKRFAITTTMICALAVSALGGEVPMIGPVPPPPPQGITASTSPGEIPTVPDDNPISDSWSALLSLIGFLAV